MYAKKTETILNIGAGNLTDVILNIGAGNLDNIYISRPPVKTSSKVIITIVRTT